MSMLAAVKEVFAPGAGRKATADSGRTTDDPSAAGAANGHGGAPPEGTSGTAAKSPGLLGALTDVFAPGGTSGDAAATAPRPAASAARHPVAPTRERARRRGLRVADAERIYAAERSFVDLLPWVEAVQDREGRLEAILLEDGMSLGAVFELRAVGTEGRSEGYLRDVRDHVQDVVQDGFEERDANQWVVQTYTWRDLDVRTSMARVRDYPVEAAAGTAYSEAYLGILERHMIGAAKDDGLFVDDEVTHERWGASVERTHMVVYRRRGVGKFAVNEPDDMMEALVETAQRLAKALEGIGIGVRPLSGEEFHGWMRRWFNTWTDLTPDDSTAFERELVGDAEGLGVEATYGDAFVESMFYCNPRSDFRHRCWWFEGCCARILTVEGLRRAPGVGHVTGETRQGDAINTLLDRLPPGTVYQTTLVPLPQDLVDGHIDMIARAAKGESVEAMRAREDCDAAKAAMSSRQRMFRAGYAFFLRARTPAELDKATDEARTLLLRYGFRAVAPFDNMRILDAYVAHLPMVYDPDRDRKSGWRYAKINMTQHIANLLPVYGRSVGTGHPGMLFWNRGGQPLEIDPLNKYDRRKNAHMLLIGPTGAGKSATLAGVFAHLVAMHRPRLFIVEAGNSFGLLVDWFASLGLSVNRVTIKPGGGARLSPFRDAAALADEAGDTGALLDEEMEAVARDEGDEDNVDVERDILQEMETVAVLMATGGEAKELDRMSRSDRRALRDAVIAAARAAGADGAQVRPDHVRDALYAFGRDTQGNERDAVERARMRELGDGIALFCDSLGGEVFNREGAAWPEVDVTLVDLAHFAREGYEAHLALACVSMINMVNTMAERDQTAKREIVFAIDEAHIVTTHPQLAPYLVKIAKMWRKLGAWLWLATQNLEDFPDVAKKLLNMIEWWIALVCPKEEVEEMKRFRELTDEQAAMMLSTRKAHRQYTEGVVMGAAGMNLFRAVPPSTVLALAATERHEKAERAEIMAAEGVSEVEAVKVVAARIDAARGIA